MGLFHRRPQAAPIPPAPKQQHPPITAPPTPAADPSISQLDQMPRFHGRDICDWLDDISNLKRNNQFDEALAIATGCMEAMIEAAEQNPANAMEHYVIEVAIIQHKTRRYVEEINTIQSWLKRQIPAPREDLRLRLHKRLAKAHETLAKQDGRDPAPFHAEWKRLLELEKTMSDWLPPSTSSVTGRSAARPETNYRTRTPKYVPRQRDLLATEFVAVDFETANRKGGASACQIALVKFSNGLIVDRLSTLLKPPPGLDHFEFTYLHGISARHTKRAPSWDNVAEHAARFVSGLPVYAHNAQFDARVWRELDEYFNVFSQPEQFFCTFRTAQRLLPGLGNYKLPTVLQECAPHYQLNHHQADSDAEACALIVNSLQRNTALHSRLP